MKVLTDAVTKAFTLHIRKYITQLVIEYLCNKQIKENKTKNSQQQSEKKETNWNEEKEG